MSTYLKSGFAMALFGLLLIMTYFAFSPYGTPLNQWEILDDEQFKNIDIPFNLELEHAGEYQFRSYFSNQVGEVLVIPRINGYAMKVFINNQRVYQVGDFSQPTANIWNYSHVIDLNDLVLQENNELNVVIYGLHDVGIVMKPSIMNKALAYPLVDFQRGITNGISSFIIGASISLAILLFLIAYKKKTDRSVYLYFGLANILYCIYNFEFVFRITSGKLEDFLLYRKVIIYCVYLASMFLMMGLKRYIQHKSINPIYYVFYFMTFVVFFSANSFSQFNLYLKIFDLFLIIALGSSMWVGIQEKKGGLVFGTVFFVIIIVHTLLITSLGISQIYLLNFGIFVYIVSLTYLVVFEFILLEKKNTTLDTISKEDPLTGVYNRKALESIQLHSTDCIIFMDIDKFKIYNDTFGHAKGDFILKDVAIAIKKHVRENDYIIRYGGEEFVVILFNSTEKIALDRGRNIEKELLALPDPIGISYGVERNTVDLLDTLMKADIKMYEMKRQKQMATIKASNITN